jgi:signal transduction histidine kinase/CHASE2 domain-containing sensor protein
MERNGTDFLVAATKQIDSLIYSVAFDEEYRKRDNLPTLLPQLTPFKLKEKNQVPDNNYVLERIPCKDLCQQIKHLGHAMFHVSADGGVRHIPLIVKIDDHYYPALSLIAVCLLKDVPLDGSGVTVKRGKYILLDNKKGWKRKIPIDKTGRMRLNYIGDIERFEQSYSFLNVKSKIDINPDSLRSHFSGKLVFIGDKTNKADWTNTPFSKNFPGVAVHATAIDNILRREFVQESSPWLIIFLALCFSGVVITSQLWLLQPEPQKQQRSYQYRILIGFIIFSCFALIYFGLALIFFHLWGRFLNFALTLMFMLLSWVLVTNYCYMEKLRREYVYRETIIQNMGNGVIVMDRSTHQVEMNSKAATLLELQSRKTTLAAIETQSAELASGLRQGLDNSLSDEFHVEREGRSFQVSIVPCHNQKRSDSTHLIAVLTDVTTVGQLSAEVQRQRDAREHDQILKNLVAKLNHDIKNDLNGIKGAATFLNTFFSMDSLSTEDIPDKTSRIIKACDQITEVLNNVSHAIRTGSIDKIATKPTLSPGDLVSLVDNVVEEMRPRSHLANIQINWERPESMPKFALHEKSLREAVRNLLLNSIEAMPNGGKITINLEHTTTKIRLCIQDTGPGIPHERQDQIFDKFFTTRTRGTGLGLAQVQEAVEQIHKGSIKINSEVGVGTEFILMLPL